jgi:4-hydroxybenzoate polyprenyltransferase
MPNSSSFANKLILLVKVSRPLGWVICPLFFMLGFTQVHASFTPIAVVEVVLLSFPLCVFLYGINDVYDYKSDRLNPRKKLVEGIKLQPADHKFVKKAAFAAAILLLAASAFTGNIFNFFSMVALLFFSYFYSAPPLRFKVIPPLDSLSNGLLYFMAPFALGFSFGEQPIGVIAKYSLLALCVAGFHSFSTIMDFSFDKKISDRTFAVVFGKRAAAVFSLAVYVSALSLARFNLIVVIYLLFSSILFLTTAVYPSEKLAHRFFMALFYGFIIAAILFLFSRTPLLLSG